MRVKVFILFMHCMGSVTSDWIELDWRQLAVINAHSSRTLSNDLVFYDAVPGSILNVHSHTIMHALHASDRRATGRHGRKSDSVRRYTNCDQAGER